MELVETVAPSPVRAGKRFNFDYASIIKSPAFLPGVALLVAITLLFRDLFAFTFEKWTGSDGYYSHGFLVPVIAGYIVYRWWPRIQNIPVKQGWLAAPFLVAALYVSYVAARTDIYSLLSVSLIACLLLGTWMVAGIRWAFALAAPIMYLAFALPIWDPLINNYTNPLQIISTKVAFQMLSVCGFHPYQVDSTNILVNGFTLDVGVPCSGLKLLLALGAFGAFFMLVARLKVWANLVFAASIIPIALFINGLRIALIGIVGSEWGGDAAHQFHDYSGYIAIILCFFILDRWAKMLGWNNKEEDRTVVSLEPKIASATKARTWAVAGLFALAGVAAVAAPKAARTGVKTEAWLESVAPVKVGDYKIVDTYKMQPSTYKELEPFGIVSRIYGTSAQSYDVVLLASDKKTSFHDPRVCFPAQGWSFDDQRVVGIPTKTRGTVPATIISMQDPQDKTMHYAAFFYRDHKGFYSTPQALSWSMFKDQFAGRTDTQGVFYRFMPETGNGSEEELKKFISSFVDEANRSSGGYY